MGTDRRSVGDAGRRQGEGIRGAGTTICVARIHGQLAALNDGVRIMERRFPRARSRMAAWCAGGMGGASIRRRAQSSAIHWVRRRCIRCGSMAMMCCARCKA